METKIIFQGLRDNDFEIILSKEKGEKILKYIIKEHLDVGDKIIHNNINDALVD